MTLGLIYWIIMLVWLVFSFWWYWPLQGNSTWAPYGVVWIMFLIIGWAVFGAPIRG